MVLGVGGSRAKHGGLLLCKIKSRIGGESMEIG